MASRSKGCAALVVVTVCAVAAAPASAARVSVFARGLDNPRGIEFKANGTLYVAEGGRGGTHSTVGRCRQVPPAVGPYTGGRTARISRIGRSGKRHTVVRRLPSSQTGELGRLVSGVADVEFLNRRLYALLAGAGCSHGVRGFPNSLIRVRRNGTWRLVANLSRFLKRHPVANPPQGDFEPDGTWYSMVKYRGAFYALEPNHGELDRITRRGRVSRVLDVSLLFGHVVPTALAVDAKRHRFYIGTLTTFPLVPGAAQVLVVTPHGRVTRIISGFTAIVGLAVRRHQLWVLETSSAAGFPQPGTGKVIRLTRRGRRTVVSGLTFPTAMTFGPKGGLYVTNKGFGFPPGAGQILRVLR